MGDAERFNRDLHQRLDHDGIDDAASARDLLDRVHDLGGVGDAFLQEVAAPVGALFEERDRVRGFGVLTQHDDADLGLRLPQLERGPDALVGSRRRHADVGQHDVGPVGGRGREQLVVGAARTDHFHLGARVEQLHDAFAHEQVVLGDQDPQHHSARLSGCRFRG